MNSKGGQSLQGFQSLCIVIGLQERTEMGSQLVVGVVIVASDGRLLQRPVHPLHPLAGKRLLAIAEKLAICPGMIGLREPVLDVVLGTGVLEGMRPDRFPLVECLPDQWCCGSDIAWRGELGAPGSGPGRAIVGEHGVDLVGNSLNEVAQEVAGNAPGGALVQFRKGKLRCPVPLGDCPAITCRAVDGHEHVQFAFGRADLGDVDMEVAASRRCYASPAGQWIG